MIYDVEFSLDAAAELLKITEVVGSAMLVLRAADQIRRHLENDPEDKGEFLSEGLYYIDEQPLRAFFLIDLDAMVVEITDFRILKSQPDESKRTSSASSRYTWSALGWATRHVSLSRATCWSPRMILPERLVWRR